ncbi:type I-F CRISPR-associated protein Csy1 [Providencia rettgeri]|uniref:type I-F CRISPR-associated protein Csy1 n=1 Tax=Providencia rettgeri TaxID=587 RepID=UPI0034E0CB04
MLDPAIEAFFTERKEDWLKSKLKASMTENEINELKQKCEEMFALSQWLPDAASRVKSRAFTSHPSTFTHPSTGIGMKNKREGTFVTPILFTSPKKNNGFLCTGNVHTEEIDSIGNAAELGIDKFLRIVLSDGQTILEHIEKETEQAKLLFLNLNYAELKSQFLSIKTPHNEVITNTRIKQVYFPVWSDNEDYHLLSLLTPSGLLFEMRRRIDKIRFSEQTKILRDLKRKGEYSEIGFKEIYGITTIGFGGTQPQNISVLNSQNAGKAHLLSSLPPALNMRETRLPSKNFFADCINPWHIKETFEAFHGLISLPKDKRGSRFSEYRDNRIQEYVDYIIIMMWKIRRVYEQSDASLPTNLSKYQQTWLFPNSQQQRDDLDDWLLVLISEITRQFIVNYNKVNGKKALSFGNEEFNAIAEVVAKNKELLR